MAKPRVHEIAAELGIDSKTALAKLKEMGEFVKGPSSSVEPPVARKLKAALAADGITAPGEGSGRPCSGSGAAPAQARPPHLPPAAQGPPRRTGAPRQPSPPRPRRPRRAPAPEPAAPAAGSRSDHQAAAARQPRPPSSIPRPGQPRPGNNPYASTQGMHRPGTPRPGNNPYASTQGMQTQAADGHPAPRRTATERAAPRCRRAPDAPPPRRLHPAPGSRGTSRRRPHRRIPPGGAPGGAPIRLRRSPRRRRPRSRPRRRHRRRLRSRRRQVQGPQVEAYEEGRVRAARGSVAGWRQRPPRRRIDRDPDASWRVDHRLRRQDRHEPGQPGDRAVPPRPDGHGDRVARRGDLRDPRRRARLQDPDGLARGRGPRAARRLRPRPRPGARRRKRRGPGDQAARSSPSWATSTTARPACSTPSATRTSSPARPAASPSTSARTR